MDSVKERLAQRIQPIERDIPDIGKVWFKRLSAERIMKLNELPAEEFTLGVLAESLCEADGTAVYSDEELRKGVVFTDLNPLTDVSCEINGLKKDDAEKKFAPPPSSPASSTSPSASA